ncbi:short-chain dehydrogenase/reductase SDR [Hyphomonas polymorpha PS728]|uniref:Short-chain dehydrogenase/reductase SDR n=1 Tax=Hyphomonas polymorpha PS728 TaxID=1280954 RepID=A0A062V946_9PROT|nr:SDR family oxidoreductase [Hyphomonas polymorpha]KCZ96642.1 short-chain dehydrogenase/reductase SDR [Hyphomonas polymorpha PS728]
MAGDTVVWVSGGSGGIGASLLKCQPLGNVRMINLDIADSPDFETIRFDLRDPTSWSGVQDSFNSTLASPRTARAFFLHCAYTPVGKGVLAEISAEDYTSSLFGNMVGVLMISSMFVRAVRPDQSALLMMMSSGAASSALPGYTAYAASKAAIERWAATAAAEMDLRGWGPRIMALRPGLVDTETARAASRLNPALFPLGQAMHRNLDQYAVTPDEVANQIWQSVLEREPSLLVDLGGTQRRTK